MKLRHFAPVALALCASGQAAQLAVYNFTTDTNSDSIAASAVFANVAAGVLTDRIDVGTTNAGVSASSDNYFARAGALPATESDAVTNGSYFDFTVTPASGYALNLSTVTFSFGTSSTSGTPYTTNAFLRTSANSFESTVGTPVSITTNTASNTFPLTASFDLSAPQYQSIGAVTFRVYLFDNSDAFGGPITRIDNVIVNGTVAVSSIPEPSTAAALVGAAGLLAGLARRRRRS